MAKRKSERKEASSAAALEAGEKVVRQARETAEDAGEQARRVTAHLTSVMQCGSIFAGAAQSVSQEWLNYAQGALRRNVEGLGGLARCRTMRDLVAAQNGRLAQELDEFAQSSRRASERLMGAAEEAAGRIEGDSRRA